MIQLLAANRRLPLSVCVKSLVERFEMIQKSQFCSLMRATEAEPTFASAWNRATGPFHQNPTSKQGETGLKVRLILLSKNAQSIARSVRAVVKGTDSGTMRPFVSSCACELHGSGTTNVHRSYLCSLLVDTLTHLWKTALLRWLVVVEDDSFDDSLDNRFLLEFFYTRTFKKLIPTTNVKNIFAVVNDLL